MKDEENRPCFTSVVEPLVGVNRKVNHSGQTEIWIHITVWPEWLTFLFTPTRGYATEERTWQPQV